MGSGAYFENGLKGAPFVYDMASGAYFESGHEGPPFVYQGTLSHLTRINVSNLRSRFVPMKKGHVLWNASRQKNAFSF